MTYFAFEIQHLRIWRRMSHKSLPSSICNRNWQFLQQGGGLLTMQYSIQFIQLLRIMFGRFDSYYYSRPVSYKSYNSRVAREEILQTTDTETNDLINFFRSNNVQFENLGGLARGIRFGDLVVERRVFNHNSTAYSASTDYVIKQWKSTNDLSGYHPTGTNIVVKSFPQLIAKLQKILGQQTTDQ